MPRKQREESCAAQHFGAWAIDTGWWAKAVRAVESGTWKRKRVTARGEGEAESRGYEMSGRIAVISIDGSMTKHRSSFGGTSTIETRRAIRKAVDDSAVGGILLVIDSPGGTVAGTGDLADDVAKARQSKPVHAFIEDLGASAAYWIASQADYVTCNPTGAVGSIGVFTVLEDDTKWQDEIGIKSRLVKSKRFKGLGADGVVTDDLVDDVQREVDAFDAQFVAAIKTGRNFTDEQLESVADGRVFIGAEANRLGLVDAIGSYDDAITYLNEVTLMTTDDLKTKHPDVYNALAAEVEAKAKADLTPKHATAAELKQAFGKDAEFFMARVDQSASMAEHKAAYADYLAGKLATANATIDGLKAEVAKHDPAAAGTSPVNTPVVSAGGASPLAQAVESANKRVA